MFESGTKTCMFEEEEEGERRRERWREGKCGGMARRDDTHSRSSSRERERETHTIRKRGMNTVGDIKVLSSSAERGERWACWEREREKGGLYLTLEKRARGDENGPENACVHRHAWTNKHYS